MEEKEVMDNFEIYMQHLKIEEAIRCVPEDHEVLTSADLTHYASLFEPYQPSSEDGRTGDTSKPLHLSFPFWTRFDKQWASG